MFKTFILADTNRIIKQIHRAKIHSDLMKADTDDLGLVG